MTRSLHELALAACACALAGWSTVGLAADGDQAGQTTPPQTQAAPDKPNDPLPPPAPEEVRVVQQMLVRDGFHIAHTDGILGPDTRDALRQFQQREGMLTTGRLDAATLAALGIFSDLQDEG